MTDLPPPWVDDLFPFPTPPALRTLVDIVWQHAYAFYQENESYDFTLLGTHYDFMFDLAAIPRPPDGCDAYPEFDEHAREPAIPMFAVPEFVPFGSLGDGGYAGWLVPAPELGRPDHPVALAGGDECGVTLIGADTRIGLEFMLSWALRRWRDTPETAWRDQDRGLADRLAAVLDVHPDPDRRYLGSSWNGTTVVRDTGFDIEFDVPEGWRHEIGEDGIGVLAPAGAYADQEPGFTEETPLEPVLATAARILDAGHPASALLVLKDTFANSPSCYFADLKPLWARAYRDLGRPGYAERLEEMTPMYQVCFCDSPHR
ncbi:hypothetical protein [Rhizohabitans arisaemae]|uniref:hypothetical protein n=1 Tax=Rhizohabitans arisaemae TaxID=2720610 RepID=UPI0024B0D101|nr:hypothetical protein [Rhizohabitans arisaemae]